MITKSTSSKTARLIYPHQLFIDHTNADATTIFILIEDDLFFRQYPFHKQKLVLHRASMMHFSGVLQKKGFDTHYIESSGSTKSMEQLRVLLSDLNITHVSHYELVDNWLEKQVNQVFDSLDIKTSRLISPGFLTSRSQIDEYFENNPNRMQNFYEWQRRRLHILIENDKPTGGKWSFDQANRKKLPKDIVLPPKYPITSSKNVQLAIEWVHTAFKQNPGNTEAFLYPISHDEAKVWLRSFIDQRLHNFGPYEDAISSRQSEIFHSVLSPLLNIGLLTPGQVVQEVVKLEPGAIPIESLEGFIRQIIGWREYMRATYLRYGSKMRTTNHLKFSKKLPQSWWTGEVGLEPIDTVIKRVLDTGYAHHIERLMILGNSMVLLRIHPDDVYEWFMSLFIDAYDWVMVPNVYAMSQFATGDLITTKPYISGSNYIIKMSDYKKAEWSEIWDALYWQFIKDHREMMENNYRSAMVVKLYDRFDNDKKERLAKIAHEWLI